jgi:hypothetical protein
MPPHNKKIPDNIGLVHQSEAPIDIASQISLVDKPNAVRDFLC